MDINGYKQEGDLIWTDLHRASKLNDIERARELLEAGADPNLRVKCTDKPWREGYECWDNWQEISSLYRGKTCVELASPAWDAEDKYVEMRALLRAYGGLPEEPGPSKLLLEIRASMSEQDAS